MVMNFLEGEPRRTGDPRDVERANIIKSIHKARGKDIPLPKEKLSTSENNLEAEWLKQAKKYIKLGFHKELDLSKEDYLNSLPKFEPQPENFKGRFDIPLIVETRIPIKRQCELVGIDYSLGSLPCVDWSGDTKDYKTPKKPYVTWMQDGTKNLDKSVEGVREEFTEDERGATVFDGLALYIARPKILEHHFIDLPGTKVGPRYAPFLGLWLGRPELDHRSVGSTYSRYFSSSCGRD